MTNNIHRIHVGSQLLEIDDEQVEYLYKKLEAILIDNKKNLQLEGYVPKHELQFLYDISN